MTSAYEPWDEARGAEIIAEHDKLEGATLVILHALQEAFGYVPEPAIPMIASALSLSRAEVHGVFTFYHDFRHEPAGRHVLKLCRAEACQSMGDNALGPMGRTPLDRGSPHAPKRSSVSQSETPPPIRASHWSRSIASGCAPPRHRRCSTAAWWDDSTRRVSMRWLRRRSDENADFRSARCRRDCRRRR